MDGAPAPAPTGTRTLADTHAALRAGPTVAIDLPLGRMWGHLMFLEVGASWLWYGIPLDGATSPSGWQAGLAIGGVGLPEPAHQP